MFGEESMRAPEEAWKKLHSKIKPEWKLAFGAAFILGLLVHLPMMVSDIPNHDGLDSMYFDQNMITSGRWFLMIACGFSSFYSVPWVSALLGILMLALTAAVLVEFLDVHSSVTIVLLSGLLVTFPALASTFAYVYTMDGYMLALFLAVAACVCVKKARLGFLAGGLCLAFSMGIYQAYLPFAMLLSVYGILELFMQDTGVTLKERMGRSLRYLYMGIVGVGAYYGILQVLLWIQGKQLADYQGISGMTGSGEGLGFLTRIVDMYRDFLAFTIKGNVFAGGLFGRLAVVILLAVLGLTVVSLMICRKWWKKPAFFAIMILVAAGVPLATNILLFISPQVNYHLLMRYQWVLFLILPLALAEKYGKEISMGNSLQWFAMLGAVVLIMHYGVTDNIAYSNLQKRYEKTYAYCVRLLDRIENTEGYYQGIPIAMIGVVGEDPFPVTDITQEVTGGMIGMNGDSLLYTSTNYQAFMKHYLGATLNFVPVEQMGQIYYTQEYIDMESFPGETGVKIVDGIMYVKTENANR